MVDPIIIDYHHKLGRSTAISKELLNHLRELATKHPASPTKAKKEEVQCENHNYVYIKRRRDDFGEETFSLDFLRNLSNP